VGNNEEYPVSVKWIKNKEPKNDLLPEELLSESEVVKLVQSAKYVRDKALIYLLYESGARIGEILSLRIKNITFGESISSILVNGKTGQRRIPIVRSSPLLKEWMERHPFRNIPTALVWVKLDERKGNLRQQKDRDIFRELSYVTVKKMLRQTFAVAGIHKRHNPHLFRHSRATFLAQHLTEAQLKQFFGWTQASDMAARYVHLSGRDLDGAILSIIKKPFLH
jgi:integrase